MTRVEYLSGAHAPGASPEDLFERFRRSGDVDALSDVFDRSAPKLLRAAMNLSPDVAGAEDLVQQTFLTAIQIAPRFDHARGLMAWLFGILANHARSVRRRERRAAPPDETPPSEDPRETAERHELEEAVARALAGMAEPYREVLVLHLRHGLSAAEIADALDRASGTVRSQIHRGLETLRKLLPAGFAAGAFGLLGGSRGLAAVKTEVLARATAAVPAGSMGALALGGLLLMKKATAVLAASIVGLTALGIAFLPTTGPDLRVASAPDLGAPLALVRPLGEAPATRAASREALKSRAPEPLPPAAARSGSVLVRTIDAQTGEPIRDVGVRIVQARSPRAEVFPLEGVTSADGTLRFAEVEPGSATLWCDRSHQQGVQVEPGRMAEVSVALPGNLDVEGLVVDGSGRGVAQATVFVFDASPATMRSQPVLRTDEAGRFLLRRFRGSEFVGARCAGYLPSRLLRVAAIEPRTAARLVLGGRAGSLHGTVVDAEGSPLAGAVVLVGDRDFWRSVHPDENDVESPAQRVFTDGKGAFRAESLGGGKVTVTAVAKGFAPASRHATVLEGGTAAVEIRLGKGATLHGSVRDPAGAPLAGVEVHVTQNGPLVLLREVTATTGADGSYRIEALAPGQLVARVSLAEKGSAYAELQPNAGEEVRWDPVLDAKGTIEGLVLGPDHEPCERWFVTANGPSRLPVSRALAVTGKDGRFVLAGLVPAPYRIEVHERSQSGGPPRASLDGILPGATGVTLLVSDSTKPSAFFAGAFVTAAGAPIGEVEVQALAETVVVKRARCKERRFELGPLTPGTYRVKVIAQDHPEVELGEHTLAAGQRLDLGDVALGAGGTLEVSLARDDGEVLGMPSVQAVRNGTKYVLRQVGDRLFRSGTLRPGAYDLWPHAMNACSTIVKAEVKSGEQTRVAITLKPGTFRGIRLTKPAGHPLIQKLRIQVWNSAGEKVVDGETAESPRADVMLGLAVFVGVGKWRFAASTETGLRAQGSFELEALTPPTRETGYFDFDLR